MTLRPPDPRGLSALIVGAICIGLAPLWVRLSETGAVATAFYRLLLALPVIAAWAYREHRQAPASIGRSDRAWMVATGAFFALDLATWHLSIRLTTVANATLLANLAPVCVTFGAWIFLRERVGTRFLVGMLLALAGAALLTGASLSHDPVHTRGDLLGIVTAVFYGAYQLGVARLRRHHSPGRILFLSSLTCIPLLAAFSVALGERLLPTSPQGWLVLAALAVTAQILGQGLITYGFAHLPASFSSLTLLIQPLVAALAAWSFLGESMSPRQILGGAVLMAGLTIARHTRAPANATQDASGQDSTGASTRTR